MEIQADSVSFNFLPCLKCRISENGVDESQYISLDISCIKGGGWPICRECGEDLEIDEIAELEEV